MCRLLLNHWKNEVTNLSFSGAELESFDVWGGMKLEDKNNGTFKKKEFEYLTVMYTEKNISIEYARESSQPFLNRGDPNVERIISANKPIEYNHSLIRKKFLPLLKKFRERFFSDAQSTSYIFVPISEEVEGRWKACICFDVITTNCNTSLSQVIDKHQEELVKHAENIYKIWLASCGRNMNLYEVRGVFYKNSLNVAKLLALGLSTEEISEQLYMTRSGVEYHIRSMKKSLGASSRAHIVAELFRKGVVS